MYIVKVTFKLIVPAGNRHYAIFRVEHFEQGKLRLFKLCWYDAETPLDEILEDLNGKWAPDQILFQDALL